MQMIIINNKNGIIQIDKCLLLCHPRIIHHNQDTTIFFSNYQLLKKFVYYFSLFIKEFMLIVSFLSYRIWFDDNENLLLKRTLYSFDKIISLSDSSSFFFLFCLISSIVIKFFFTLYLFIQFVCLFFILCV